MSRIYGSIGRRHLLQWMGIGGIGAIAATAAWSSNPQFARAAESQPQPIDPDAALKRLLAGNQRFVRQKRLYPDQSKERLQAVASAQHPFATLLSCADSRVTAEIIFDEGLGDLFDVRVAGNIVTPEVLGSLEYAAVLLETPVLMVLGHERCGAVTAAVQDEPLPGSIGRFVEPIEPAIARAKSQPGDPVENAVVANVRYQIERLKENSPLLVERSRAGKLKIVGGRYDLDTGEVTLVV